MTSKLSANPYAGAAKPVEPAAGPAGAGRRLHRLGRHWAIAVNWKLLGAVGLALLVWALIVAVVLSL